MVKKHTANKTDAKPNFATNYAELLQAITAAGTTNLGQCMGRDAAFVTRLKTDQTRITLTEFAALITYAGLNLYQSADDMIKIDRHLVQSLIFLSSAGLTKAMVHIPEGESRVTVDKRLFDTLEYLAKLGINHLDCNGGHHE